MLYVVGVLKLGFIVLFNIDEVLNVICGDYVNVFVMFDVMFFVFDNVLLSGMGILGMLCVFE